MLFHGGGGSAATVSGPTGGFSALADRSGFIAVYPDSVAGYWDDGRETLTARTNDVAFTAALLDALAIEYKVDARRVYASGISNGGMMVQRLACELSNRIAAVASVAANMPSAVATTCSPARAMPVVMFSGTADPLMPYNGGSVVSPSAGLVLSAPATASWWAAKNQAAATPQVAAWPDVAPGDGTTTDGADLRQHSRRSGAVPRQRRRAHLARRHAVLAGVVGRHRVQSLQRQRRDVGILHASPTALKSAPQMQKGHHFRGSPCICGETLTASDSQTPLSSGRLEFATCAMPRCPGVWWARRLPVRYRTCQGQCSWCPWL
jgi:pimeloyl-ACP methyl ester carboxylesterase